MKQEVMPLLLKGNRSEEGRWHEFSFQRNRNREKYNSHFGARNLTFSKRSYVDSLLTDEEQKRVSSWRIGCFSPHMPALFMKVLTAHSGLVHEGAATNCWAQNGDTHGHISETFKRRLLTNGTEQLSEKLPRVLLFSLFFFPFLSLGHVMLLLFSDLL